MIDTRHTLSALYDLVNVPSGVMVDEEGRVVRLDEGTYTRKYTAGALEFGTDEYVPMLRDWLEKGEASAYVKSPAQMAEELSSLTRNRAEAEADAHFRLGVYLYELGDEAAARRQWEAAQELHPDSWNYHRQDWSFDPSEAGRRWFEKFQSLEGKPYYRPMVEPEN